MSQLKPQLMILLRCLINRLVSPATKVNTLCWLLFEETMSVSDCWFPYEKGGRLGYENKNVTRGVVLSLSPCSMLASLAILSRCQGKLSFNLVLTYFNYAQFKAENVIRALALEMRSIKEQENSNSLSENSRYLTQRHRQIMRCFR